MTAEDTLLTHEELIAHLKWLHLDDRGDDVGHIRLHKVAYFSFGYYLWLTDKAKHIYKDLTLCSVPFPNIFVNGKFGACLETFMSHDDLYDIEPKEWHPATLNGMLFYGIMLSIKDALDPFGDFQLVELTLDGSVFRNYPYEMSSIATSSILTEMQERFS